MSFIVAIDGPAGSGKGTITKLLAQKLNFLTMDTGAMYRCVTLYLLKNNINKEETEKVELALKDINIDMKEINGVQNFFLNNKNIINIELFSFFWCINIFKSKYCSNC